MEFLIPCMNYEAAVFPHSATLILVAMIHMLEHNTSFFTVFKATDANVIPKIYQNLHLQE